ncbi:hypothetical protein ABH966_003358 [Lysinibacillus sp. RC46]
MEVLFAFIPILFLIIFYVVPLVFVVWFVFKIISIHNEQTRILNSIAEKLDK